MRRRFFTLALVAALSITPLWAQRGGGGGHAGGSVGGGGHMAGGGGVAHSGGGGYAYHGSGGGYAHAPSYSGSYHAGGSWNGGNNHWNGNNWHGNYPYRGWGYGRWGYPYWGGGYVGWGGYPYWGWGWGGNLGWYGYYGSYDNYTPDIYAATTYSAQTYPSYVYVNPNDGGYTTPPDQQTQDQIDRLNNEVEQLRSQQASQNPPQGKTVEIHADTVLVFRDGHAEEVQNYAIAGKTLWVFDESRARKVPIASLDLPATKHSNEDRGIDFVVPASAR